MGKLGTGSKGKARTGAASRGSRGVERPGLEMSGEEWRVDAVKARNGLDWWGMTWTGSRGME